MFKVKMYKVNNLIEPSDLSDTKLQGYIGRFTKNFVYNRITSDYAKEVIYKETEDAFRNRIDDEGEHGIWQGEYWGKWIISAVRACRYLGDESLKSFIRDAAYTLIGFQDERGYIGTYRNSLNMFRAKVTATNKSEWNWNIWCRKYTLWGLLEAYMLLNDGKILVSAARFASHLISELHDNNIKIVDTGMMAGFPSCSILKPMVLLYELTGESEYIDFAVEIATQWEDPEGKKPNIITNAFSGKPIHEWYPDSQKWAKAYEMMSCLDGLLELYRITGTVKYYEAVSKIYDFLREYEMNIMSSVGYNDIFAHAADKINAISEPCDIVHWCRLSYELFCLTGDAKYMNIFEDAFYNGMLASIRGDAKWGMRGVRSSNRHFMAPPQAKMKYNHCCVNNIPRALFNMAQASVMQSGKGVYLNFFTPSETVVRFESGKIGGTISMGGRSKTGEIGGISSEAGIERTIRIKVDGDYFGTGAVTVEADNGLDTEINLFIRVPEWSRRTRINNGGDEAILIRAGMDGGSSIYNNKNTAENSGTHDNMCDKGYFRISLKPGARNIVNIGFDLNPRIIDFPVEPEAYSKDDWRSQRWMIPYNAVSCVPYEYMVWERKSVVKVGPLLLAQSRDAGGGVDAAGSGNSADSGSIKSVSSINSGSSSDADFSNTCSGNDMFKSGSVCGKGYRCSVTPAADPDESFLRTYDVELSSYSDSIKIKMCDYASACKAVEPDERYFNIYL